MALDMNTNNVYHLDMTGITGDTTITLANENNLPTEEILTDWGDGTQNSELTHTYSTAGEYIVISNLQNGNTNNNMKGYLTKATIYYCTTPASLFFTCAKLKEVNLTDNWVEKTIAKYGKNVSLSQVFYGCTNLETANTIQLTKFKPTHMVGTFYNCKKIKEIDLTGLDTSSVKGFNNCFAVCETIREVKGMENWDTSSATDMTSMFAFSFIPTLNLSSWDFSKVTTMYQFAKNSRITSIDLSNATFNNTRFTEFLYSNLYITTVNLSGANISGNMESMFLSCSKLENINLTNAIIKPSSLKQTFGYCSKLTSLDTERIDVSSCKSMESTFKQCSSLTSLDLSSWDVSQCTTMGNMFNGCKKLEHINLLSWDTSKAIMPAMFSNCSSLTELDLSSFTTNSVPNFSQMFNNCEKLESLDISNFKVDNADNIVYMFDNCPLLKKVGLLYADSSTINNIMKTNIVSSSPTIYYHDADPSQLTPVEGVTFKKYQTPTIQLPPHIQLHSLPDGTRDEVDIKTGILTRNVGCIVLDGENTQGVWTGTISYNNTLRMSFIFNDNYSKKPKSSASTITPNNIIVSTEIYDGEHIGIDADGNIRLFLSKNKASTSTEYVQYLRDNPITLYYTLKTPTTEQLILNYNNSCDYGRILPRGTSDNYNVITNEYKQNLDFIPIDGSIAFDTATIKDTTVKFSVALSKFEVDTTNVRGSDGIYCDNDLFKYEVSDNDYEHTYIENDTTLHVYVNKNRLNSYDQVGFQLYLTSNPFNIYYAMRTPIISYVNYEDLDPEKASWEMLDCTEDGSITIESGNMDKTLLLDCMDYVAPTKNRFEVDLLKANTQYTVYAEGVSGGIQLNFGGNIVNFTNGNIYTSGETQSVEFYTDNEIKNLIIIEGDTRNETIEFFEGLTSSENITVISSNSDENESNKISYEGITLRSLPNGVKDEINVLTGEYIQRVDEREYSDGDFEDGNVLTDGTITVYELETQIIHQLDAQSLIAYQDGYISMEVETNYPSFIYSLPSTNTFYIPNIKNMTQYTLKYPVGSGTVTIGNIQYNVTSDSMLFTTPIEITGDKNSLVFETDDNPTEVIILEGNYSDREIKYFTGINSVINPIIRVTNSLTGDSVEYKGNSDIALYSLPNKMSDKLDVLTGYLMRVTGIREYQDGDYELDDVFTDGINTIYKLDSPLLYRNINFPIPTLNSYGTIELDSDEAIPQFNYRTLSNNYYPLELLEPNSTYTMIGEAQTNTTFTLGGTYVGNYSGGKVVVNLGSVTENSLKFSNDIGLKNFMLVKGDATNSTLPFYTGIKSVEDISFLIKGYDGRENSLVLDDSIVLRECGGVYDSIDLINYTMTKRLNEIVLVGTEYWSVETSKSVDSNYQLFSLAVTSAKDTKNAKIYCDKLIHKYLGNDTDCVYFENNKLYLCINKYTIGGDNINALKVWLTKNNVKIIYPLINNVKLDLDVVWEITPPTSYETQTEFGSSVALDSLKPMLALTVATTTLEDVVSTLEAQNAKLEEENIATMLALTGIYETMVVPTIDSGVSTVNLSDGKDGNSMNGMSISPMGMIYAKLVKKGLKTIEQVPAHLQTEVKYVLKEDK